MRLGVEAALVRGELLPGDVEVEDGRVVGVGLGGAVRGRVAVPGFLDLQVNGFGGVDFLAASTEDYVRAGEALLETGVTAYQPTFITAAESTIVDALRALPPDGGGPRGSAPISRGRSSLPSAWGRIRASTGVIQISSCSTGCSTPAA